MASVKTYLLAPNFTLQPGGPLRLGSIIADPYRPTKPLTTPKPSAETITHTEYECMISNRRSRSLHGSIWASFLQTASANVGGGGSNDVLTQYTMDSLETIYYTSDPTDAEAAAWASDAKVQAAMRAGLMGAQPVYMITGLKIAKGFRMTSETEATREGNVGAGVPVTGAEVSVGADVEFSRGKTAQETLRAGADIVFAYQLHVIAEKGWRRRKRRVEVDVYTPRGAFLGEGRDEAGGENKAFEASVATADDLLEFARESEDDTVKSVETRDEHDEACICLSFQED